MSTLYVSPDGREMLDLVDKLRNMDKIEKTIPLPQIVVVGQQSCGKSSVLHAISGIQFPTDDGLCTQFPTEIILRRENIVSTKASIRYPADAPEQFKADCRGYEERWSNTSLKNLKDMIADAKAVLKLNEHKRFCPESLVLEVSGPEQEHLTLIDLPGFFVSTQVNQHASDIALVNKIAEQYINKERAIVLAVISGKNDFENQKILEDLKNDENFRNKTLGVITAPDQIERGSRREQECVSLLHKDPRNLGYGWHMLRNLKYSEVKAGSFDRDEVERLFFEQNTPWTRLDRTKVGNQALKIRLSSILKKNIAHSLPEIQQEVNDKLDRINNELGALGDPRSTPEQLRSFLYERANRFKEEIEAILSGAPPTLTHGSVDPKVSLRAFVRSQYEQFANEMFDQGRTWKCVDQGPEFSLSDLQAIYDGKVPGTSIVPASQMVNLLTELIKQHRGEELPNLVHPAWATTLFQHLSQRWTTIAKTHCDIIFQEVQRRVIEAVERIADDNTADRLLSTLVEPALRERGEALDEKLKELCWPYTRSGTQCLSRKYLQRVRESDNTWKRTVSFHDQCIDILRSAEYYYDIACDVFTENVANLGVENCLLRGLDSVLSQHALLKMDDAEIAALGEELPEIIESRQRLTIERKQFEEARDQILPRLGSRRSRPSKRLQGSADAVGSNAPPSDLSIAVTQATPPATPQKLPSWVASTSPNTLDSRSPSAGRPISPRDGSSSPSTNGFSSPAHSRSASSVSSYQGSPRQRKLNTWESPKVLVREDSEEQL